MSDAVVLEVSSHDGTAFSCGIRGWVQTPEEKRQWQRLIDHIVRYAFLSRPATLMTLSPMAWSIGHSLPGPRLVQAGAERYLVNDIPTCSAELLTELAESEEFGRGLLWLSTVLPASDAALLTAIGDMDLTSDKAPASNAEMLVLLDDGRRIHWLHPNRDLNVLEAEVVAYAETLHWHVS
jgi:hypothetical protein